MTLYANYKEKLPSPLKLEAGFPQEITAVLGEDIMPDIHHPTAQSFIRDYIQIGDWDEFEEFGLDAYEDVIYTSTDSEVAEAGGSGNCINTFDICTSHKVGTAIITVTLPETDEYAEGSFSFTVHVVKGNNALNLSKASDTVNVDSQTTFTVENPTNGTLSVESNDTNIAECSLDGNTVTVTGKAAGTTTITVTSAETDICKAASQTFTVTVNKSKTASTLKAVKDVYGAYKAGENKCVDNTNVYVTCEDATATITATSSNEFLVIDSITPYKGNEYKISVKTNDRIKYYIDGCFSIDTDTLNTITAFVTTITVKTTGAENELDGEVKITLVMGEDPAYYKKNKLNFSIDRLPSKIKYAVPKAGYYKFAIYNPNLVSVMNILELTPAPKFFNSGETPSPDIYGTGTGVIAIYYGTKLP